MANKKSPLTLLTFPLEIREKVYEFVMKPVEVATPGQFPYVYNVPTETHRLPEVCHQVKAELEDRKKAYSDLRKEGKGAFWNLVIDCTCNHAHQNGHCSSPDRIAHSFVVPTPESPEYSKLFCSVELQDVSVFSTWRPTFVQSRSAMAW